MALVKCKECGRSISTSAKACPECGAQPPKKASLFTKFVAGVIGLGVVGAIVGDLERSLEQEQKAKAEVQRLASLTPEQRALEEKAKAKVAREKADRKRLEDRQWQNTMVAMAMIKRSLRDPDSLRWMQIHANDDGSVVCAKYRARNGSGGMNVERKPVIAGTPMDSVKVWNENCADKPLYVVSAAADGFAQFEKPFPR